MKPLSQYISEYREKFLCKCPDHGEHLEPNTTYKELEEHFAKALTEVAKGMAGDVEGMKKTTKILAHEVRIAEEENGYNHALSDIIAEQEEKFNKFIQ
jgi:hypothetical protein